MHFAIATRLYVPNPEAAAQCLKNHLGFQIEYRTAYGWWAENGSVAVILQASDMTHALLEVQCSDIKNDAASLLQHSDIHAVSDMRQEGNRIEQTLQCDCGITLVLSKALSEDDMDELIPLPASLAWDEKVDEQSRRMLRIVPLSFREKARLQITERAEYIAVEQGELCVQENHAMQAFVDITLDFQYQALSDAMQQEGIDANHYMKDVDIPEPSSSC